MLPGHLQAHMGHNGHFLKMKTVFEDKRFSLLKLRLEMLMMVVAMIKRATGVGRPDMVGVHQEGNEGWSDEEELLMGQKTENLKQAFKATQRGRRRAARRVEIEKRARLEREIEQLACNLEDGTDDKTD